ncbi:MAG: hypothetical protein WCD83_27300, partial [Pseudolabrys sp.]
MSDNIQAPIHPQSQSIHTLSAHPVSKLFHRGCGSSTILLEHVEHRFQSQGPSAIVVSAHGVFVWHDVRTFG